MMQLLFRNRWLALMWVVVSLVSIGSYVSEGGGHEQLDQASAEIRAQRAEMQRDDGGHNLVIDANSDGFTAEDQLIDTADPDAEKQPAQPKAAAVPQEEIADTYVLVDNPPAPVGPPPTSVVQP